MAALSKHHHDWEHSKENAVPLVHGRSTKSLSKRPFGTSATKRTQQFEEETKTSRSSRDKWKRLGSRCRTRID